MRMCCNAVYELQTPLMAFNRCRNALPCTTLSQMACLAQDFEEFFSECRKQGLTAAELRDICQPLYARRCKYSKFFKLCVAVGATMLLLYLLCIWFDGVAWFMSAIGRLVLLQVLPFWDWTPLYSNRCLISREIAKVSKVSATSATLGRGETDASNCALCDSIERIPTASNVTYSFLESQYLERGLPVIVTDSHTPETLKEFLLKLQNTPTDFLESDPCDVATNLMLKKLFNLELALEKVHNFSPMDRWFLQWRNCQSRAVKASRRFVTRPYYYPLHLEPFYSSWVLMSQNYATTQLREIYLQGLVFMQQIQGSFEVRLRPKTPCESKCPEINIRLSAGECLVFSTDLWLFSYGGADAAVSKTAALATLLEIDWRL